MHIRLLFAFAVTAVLAPLAACGQSITGRACSESNPCPATHHCIPDQLGEERCMADCSGDDDTLCPDGSLCADGPGGLSACWLGGSTPIGQSCASNLECVQGGICVGRLGGDDTRCFQACNFAEGCNTGGTCQMSVQGNGFCSR